MNWKKKVFENFRLYVVTDLGGETPEVDAMIEAAYRGGADIVQLRSKGLSDAALYRIGTRMRKIADRYRRLFFVNDRPDLAVAVEADGVHLGQEDLPMTAVRKILQGKDLFVGRSTHSLEEALQASWEGVDYIGVGPIFETPTKPAYPAVGLDLIRQVKQRMRIPFVTIGGIDLKNIHAVLEAGALRVAVVRAIFGAPDIEEATKVLRKAVDSCAN